MFTNEDGEDINLSAVVAYDAGAFGRAVSQILFSKEELTSHMFSPKKVAPTTPDPSSTSPSASQTTPSVKTANVRLPLTGARAKLFKGNCARKIVR